MIFFNSEREALLESSIDFKILYRKTIFRNNTASSPAKEEVNLYYIYFVKSSSSLFYEINNNVNKPIITNIILEED